MFEGQSFALKARGLKVDLESLPKPDTVRWVARRKAEVVIAVSIGLLTTNEACRRYNLSVEELNDWRRKFGHEGLDRTDAQRGVGAADPAWQRHDDRSPLHDPRRRA